MKKYFDIGLLNIVQIFLIIALSVSIAFFVICKLNLDVLALIISVVSLSLTILSTVSKSIDDKKTSEVFRITSRQDDKGLFDDIENEVNRLRNEGKIIDSIHLVDASGFIDHRKEVIIIYH